MLYLFDYILFDLDGTIVDTKVGIINGIKYAINKLKLPELNEATMESLIGPPLKKSFMKVFGVDSEKGDEIVLAYREYYMSTGIEECSLYPGIAELLVKLHKMNKKILLATSKPSIMANHILTYFDLYKYFHFVAGSELDGSRVVKSEVIRYAIDNADCDDAEKCLMIGDRIYDIEGAKNFGIKTIAVKWGFGSKNEFADADWIVDTKEEILNIV